MPEKEVVQARNELQAKIHTILLKEVYGGGGSERAKQQILDAPIRDMTRTLTKYLFAIGIQPTDLDGMNWQQSRSEEHDRIGEIKIGNDSTLSIRINYVHFMPECNFVGLSIKSSDMHIEIESMHLGKARQIDHPCHLFRHCKVSIYNGFNSKFTKVTNFNANMGPDFFSHSSEARLYASYLAHIPKFQLLQRQVLNTMKARISAGREVVKATHVSDLLEMQAAIK